MYMKFNLQNFFIWMLVVFSVLSRTKFSARDHRNFCWELTCLWFSVHKERIDRWNFLIFQLFESCKWGTSLEVKYRWNSVSESEFIENSWLFWFIYRIFHLTGRLSKLFCAVYLTSFFLMWEIFLDQESSKPASNKMKPYKVFMQHIYMWIMRELWC